jgi:hypothetical protein
MARLNLPKEQVAGYHQEFDEAPGDKLPDWARNWIVDAVTPRTFIHEGYRKMGWDLDGDICKAISEFRSQPGGYSPEDAAFDLRQIWRRLLRRYAFREARSMEGEIWRAEKETCLPNKWLFRIWRIKDLCVLQLGIAVMIGFALLASSSGLMDILKQVQGRKFWWLVLAVELAATLFLAFVEVQRRVGRRPWWSVLCHRALVVTAWGMIWTLPEARTF